ncbi:MAG: ATP-dependent Clp protease adaptor ClpS, partial [Armatimonadetes bacterium]|nr:ATP-dependent Clp protease adaptor ClpS [Armatimonadota bacterium]
PDGESGPYRGLPKGNANTDVIFWNDKKTTQEFVTQVLRGTFGVVEPEATRLVLSVDQAGFAVVGNTGSGGTLTDTSALLRMV